MPNCLDKKRNEILSLGEYYPYFEGYGIHSNTIISIVKLDSFERGGAIVYKYDSSDYANIVWCKVIFPNGTTGSMPIINVVSIDQI